MVKLSHVGILLDVDQKSVSTRLFNRRYYSFFAHHAYTIYHGKVSTVGAENEVFLWIIPLFVFFFFLIIRLVVAPYEIFKEQKSEIAKLKIDMEAIGKNFATPDELIPTDLKGLSIRISDLVREDVVIRNKIFEDCHIYGPAFITPIKDTSLEYNNFEGSLESNLIELKKEQF